MLKSVYGWLTICDVKWRVAYLVLPTYSSRHTMPHSTLMCSVLALELSTVLNVHLTLTPRTLSDSPTPFSLILCSFRPLLFVFHSNKLIECSGWREMVRVGLRLRHWGGNIVHYIYGLLINWMIKMKLISIDWLSLIRASVSMPNVTLGSMWYR